MARTLLTADDVFGGKLGGCSVIHWGATEVANKHAAKHGRTCWNDDDQDVYLAEYYRRLEILSPGHPAVAQYKRDAAGSMLGHNGGPALDDASRSPAVGS